MKEEILALRAQGLSYKQIKTQLGCSMGVISYHCGVGQKEKTLERARSRRSKKKVFLQEQKHNKPCSDCGEVYPAFVMDYDHLGDKVTSLSLMASQPDYSIEDMIAEIAKCELVCANCHRFRTWSRRVTNGADTIFPDVV